MENLNTKVLPLFVAGLILFAFSGCDDLFDDGKTTYDGPPVVEFKPLSQSVTLSPDDVGTLPLKVQLIGEQRNEPLEINYVVNEESSAEEGVHYSLPNTSAITIPADSSSAEFPITVMMEDPELKPGDTVQLILDLQGSDQVEPAKNLKTFTLTIQRGTSGD